jgi:hypothetical protein
MYSGYWMLMMFLIIAEKCFDHRINGLDILTIHTNLTSEEILKTISKLIRRKKIKDTGGF